MSTLSVTLVGLLILANLAPVRPRAGEARKDGLSLVVRLDKKVYQPEDPVKLSFTLKNETDRELFIGDGYLAPDYHEVGPGRHFEVHLIAEKRSPLRFWSGLMTEGNTSGIRKVFKLKPGETYKGVIRLSAGAKDRDFARQPHEERGGSFEDKTTRRKHVLGKDGRKYTVRLRYQVNPTSHGVWKPPADFKPEQLWKGVLTTTPLSFEIKAR
jgi:hypothetical protein